MQRYWYWGTLNKTRKIKIAVRSKLGSSRRGTDVGDLVVEEAGEELGIVLAGDLGAKVLRGELVLVALWRLAGELVGLLAEQPGGVGLVDRLALGSLDAVTAPLPEL